MKAVLSAMFVGLVILANWLASKYLITVPFTSLIAPAGVLCIGAVLVIRDWLQQIAGLWWSLALVYIAGVASYLIGNWAGWTSLQKIAVASIVAFTVSETVEALIFTPIRKRSLTVGVALSATAGTFVDSVLFLWLAFGGFAFLEGQIVGKLEMVTVGVCLTAARRVWLPVRAA